MKEINITKHGYKRLIERTNCKRNNVQEFIAKIWLTGNDKNIYKPNTPMSKYIINVCKNSGMERCAKIKGNTIYLFNNDGSVFVTCYDIPQKVLQNKKNKIK